MDMLVVEGGRPLRGTVTVSGSKNAALPILAATLAVEGPVHLEGVPDLVDVHTLTTLLSALGATATTRTPGRWDVRVGDESPCLADYELVRRMRAGVCVLGPLLARRGRACVSLPGGCNIGHRPIDLHLKGLRALGARIRIDRGYVFAEADRLTGAEIDLTGPQGSTVTGTANVLVAACLARGTTTLHGAAREPEIVDLGHFLNAAGARIRGLGTSRLVIEGVAELHGVSYRIIPDRIEAATLLVAAAITQGELRIGNTRREHLSAVLQTLHEIGVAVESDGIDGLHVAAAQELRSTEITASPYPGVPTDVQAQFTALLSLATGRSVVTDTVFPDRFLHIPELCRMGAHIRREPGRGLITGVRQLSGACVMASDLRASAALLLAALAAKGESVIRRIYHLDRGYERLENKLNAVGAVIRRVNDAPEHLPDSLRVLGTMPPLTEDDAPPIPPPKFLAREDAAAKESAP
uniref:UDP-N-acetylglucosamine 1-carboxyvinyltransferase n=1 Tax=Schlesneria paludicola TaxID=360056 RepID=A0A7C2K0B6_9PLAN